MNSPLNVTRLSFDSYADFQAYTADNAEMLKQVWLWHETIGNQAAPVSLPGVCDLCECQTKFTVTPNRAALGDQFEFRARWWGELRCGCGKNYLDRAVFRVFLDECKRDGSIYHVGEYSDFRRWLSTKATNVLSSQYQEGRGRGEITDGIRYEDLTGLSFGDASFDCIVCMEVLEHIPHYRAALPEMARTLAVGGKALLTFPWIGQSYDHLTRAEVTADGTIRHILPPEYHGDPANRDGILSFRSFGWRILDEMRGAGFSRAFARCMLGPLHGYVSLINPVIVGVR